MVASTYHFATCSASDLRLFGISQGVCINFFAYAHAQKSRQHGRNELQTTVKKALAHARRRLVATSYLKAVDSKSFRKVCKPHTTKHLELSRNLNYPVIALSVQLPLSWLRCFCIIC